MLSSAHMAGACAAGRASRAGVLGVGELYGAFGEPDRLRSLPEVSETVAELAVQLGFIHVSEPFRAIGTPGLREATRHTMTPLPSNTVSRESDGRLAVLLRATRRGVPIAWSAVVGTR